MAYELPTCEECKAKVYEGHVTGRARLKETASGRSFDRPDNMPPPCYQCPKIPPKDRLHNPTPAKATEATERHYQALFYYRLMKYDRNGTLPYDGLTLQNNVLIAQAEEEAKDSKTPLIASPVPTARGK